MTISCTFANAENTQVTFTDNSGETRTVPADWPGHFRMEELDGGGVIGFLAAGGTIAPYVAPDAPAPDPTPYLYATAQIAIADSDIASISVSAKLSGAFRFDVGIYWVFFTDEQPDTQYMALVYDGGVVRSFVTEADKFTDYFVVTTTDFTGAPADPEAINIEIKRVS